MIHAIFREFKSEPEFNSSCSCCYLVFNKQVILRADSDWLFCSRLQWLEGFLWVWQSWHQIGSHRGGRQWWFGGENNGCVRPSGQHRRVAGRPAGASSVRSQNRPAVRMLDRETDEDAKRRWQVRCSDTVTHHTVTPGKLALALAKNDLHDPYTAKKWLSYSVFCLVFQMYEHS